jgi:hypothetical protein
MGDGIDYDEVMRMRDLLRAAIEAIAQKPTDDSPVYTFLSGLKPPIREMADAAASSGISGGQTSRAIAASDQSATVVSLAVQAHEQAQIDKAADDGNGITKSPTISSLMQAAQIAIDNSEFATARAILTKVRQMAPRDSYVTQKLAFATYKSKQPTTLDALREAQAILRELATEESTDTETLGLWAAIHKRIWQLAGDTTDLDTALAANEKAFILRNDPWNGINLAFLYSERAGVVKDPDDAEADRAVARRTRKKVLELCQHLSDGDSSATPTYRYWLLATMSQAWLGLGDEAKAQQFLAEANAQNPAEWMRDATSEQMDQLRKLL